jgi:hypothetical protein
MHHTKSICNIQMKHKSKTSETLKTQRRRWAQPTWWGMPVTSKLVSRDLERNGPADTPGAARRPPFFCNAHARWGRRRKPPLPLLLRREKWMGGWHGAQSSARCGRAQQQRGRLARGATERGHTLTVLRLFFLRNCGA